MSKLQHKGKQHLTAKQLEQHNALTDPILALSDSELDTWFDANVTSPADTRAYLKRITRILASQVKS